LIDRDGDKQATRQERETMVSLKVRVTLGVVLVLSCAVAALVDDARHADADGSLVQACAGMPASHQLESALFNARAQSNGGFDPICGAIESPVAAAAQPSNDRKDRQRQRPDTVANSR
jgi:hypothetical protein